MFDIKRVIKSTNAYKILKKDKEHNSLSHAYLLVSNDETYLKDYLKIFAKLICCKEEEFCDSCRTCNLIEKENHTDVAFLPKDKAAVLTEDVDYIIENAFVKPFEEDKRLFVITKAESMNAVAQNKLLKILEEPPENVYILLGAISEYPLLNTVLSRVKKLKILERKRRYL